MLSDSEIDEDFQITINEHFANAYAQKKEREELRKLKEKYNSDLEDVSGLDLEDSENSDISEDEDGEELTPAMDAAILRTLVRIKRKDPDIYDNKKNIFEEEKRFVNEPTSLIKQKTKVPKPITIKQQILSSMLNSTNPTSRSPSPQPLTYEQEQQALRAEVIVAFNDAAEDTGLNEDNEDFLISRENEKDEIEKEDLEYHEFLTREVGEDIRSLIGLDSKLDDVGNIAVIDKTSKKKKKKKLLEETTQTNSNRSADEDFLMNYVLNRGWIDRGAKHIPTYHEITRKKQKEGGNQEEEDDKEFEEIADNFESSYNFRFEEPNGATIATFPRDVDSAVRRHDTRRKEARERRKQRREEELSKKREELKRLKTLKAKELKAKLEKIEKEGGVEIDSEVFATFNLDGDWDPQKHDEQMAIMYADDEGEQEIERPHWDHDINIDDVLPEKMYDSEATLKLKKRKRASGANEDDANQFNVDVMQPPADWDGTEDMRKMKVQEYLDEVYSMGFNDIIGDIPTRFSYAQVAPQNYGVTADEILKATDADLNQYMGLKKLASYRKGRRGYDATRMDRLKELRAKINGRRKNMSEFMMDDSNASGERTSKKRKGRRERQRLKSMPAEDPVEVNT